VRDEAPTCAVCRQDVTPGVPGVMRAVEVFHEQDFGGASVEAREGKVIFLHEAHVPAETGATASTEVTRLASKRPWTAKALRLS
jgi:hypothetical protein